MHKQPAIHRIQGSFNSSFIVTVLDKGRSAEIFIAHIGEMHD